MSTNFINWFENKYGPRPVNVDMNQLHTEFLAAQDTMILARKRLESCQAYYAKREGASAVWMEKGEIKEEIKDKLNIKVGSKYRLKNAEFT